MKHVWILNHYAQTPDRSGATRHFHLAKELAAYGWKASIIAASVEMHTKKQRLNPGEAYRLEMYEGIPFLWIGTPLYTENNWRRMLNMLAYAGRVLLPWTTKTLARPDAIIGSSVHPFAALAGALLAFHFRVPFLFEVRDLWPQTLIDMGRLSPDGVTTRLMRGLEKWLYRRARYIISVLPNAYEYIVPLGIDKDKIVWIPNGVDLSAFPVPAHPAEEHDPFTLMYFGAHGRPNGLDNIILAMELLQKRKIPVRLRLIGEGGEKNSLKEMVAEKGLNNVVFEDSVPKEKIPQLAREADAFVFNILNLPLYRFGISLNKLFDYFAAAKPIIYGGAAANDPVSEARAGITVPPEDPGAMAGAVEKLLSMSPQERSDMGRNGRRYVEEKHAFGYLAGKLAQALDKAVSLKK